MVKANRLPLKALPARRAMNLRQLLLATSRMVNGLMTAKLLQRGHKRFRPTHLSLYSNVDFDGTRLNVLATRANMTKQAMWQLANELQELGYVKRRIDASDRRNRIILLTAEGNRLMLECMDALEQIESELRDSVGQDAYANLRETLKALSHSRSRNKESKGRNGRSSRGTERLD